MCLQCSFVEATSLVVTDAKKVVEETSPDNRTSIFGDISRFGGSNSGGNNGSVSSSDGKCCECDKPSEKTLDKKEKEQQQQQFRIEFENALHNRVYVKNQ